MYGRLLHNSIELICAQVKSYVARKGQTFKLVDFKVILEESTKVIGTYEEENYVRHVIKEAEKMMSLDGNLNDAITAISTSFTINEVSSY